MNLRFEELTVRAARMKILEWIEEEVGALVVATTAAVFGAIGAFLLTIFVGTRFVRGELGAWFGIMPGLPVALIVGAMVLFSFFGRCALSNRAHRNCFRPATVGFLAANLSGKR
jgi:hypothetical protein